MKIPTILKGDDAGAITLSLDSSRSYDGATLVVAYQGATKTFTGLAAGGTVSLVYNHVETAAFRLGCYPMEARLIGAGGSVETVSNAEWRIKVTDIVSEVNCGGSFAVVPGAASVPVTDVEELGGHYKLPDLAAKINEVCRILAQRTAPVSGPSAGPFGAVALVLLFSLGAFAANVQTARLDDMYNDERVVTNVTFEGLATPGAVSNIVTKAYVEDLGITADFSTNNAALVETIEATAPAPTADEIGAVAKAFVAEEYDPGKDYKIGDVVRIDGRFYVFIDDWYHQWGGSPIDYEAAVELSDLGEVIKYRNARDFLTLGDGGTNSPSFKRILTGWDNGKPCYFTIETTGWIIDGPYLNKIRLVNQELRVTTNNWDSFWSLRLPEVLQKENVAPMSNEYFSEEFKKSPTSPWHVHSYLTNNYTRTADMAVTYLTKNEASNTYISEAAADSKYSTPAGIASAISSALDNFRPQYLYNKDGNYRLDVNGKVQRQAHNGYNVNWTNDSTGVVFVYSNPDSWTCNHPTLGAIHFTRSDGVMYCIEYPPVRATEDYPNTTVLSFGAPIGTMRAIPNAAGSILWNDYKQFADAASVPTKPEDIGAASPGTVSNIVTKAYVEGLGISSEETDPTIGLTNGTIYVKGSTITPLTSHQSLSGYVPTSRTVNSKPLSSNVTLDASDVGATTPADVTAAIREQSLGGIWDAELEVWWTPRMRNGNLTYEATTNVNLNAVN